MNSDMKYLDINLDIDEKYLYLNQETTLRIDIKNNSNYIIENGLFRLILNDNIFKVLDEDLVECTRDFRKIVDIEPGFKVSIDIPVKVISIPQTLTDTVFCYMNFHIMKDSKLNDDTYKSNELLVNFISKINEDSFKFKFEKEKYFIDEELNILVSFENSTKYSLTNIIVENFKCENTSLVKENIKSSKINQVIVNNKYISIKKLEPGETIDINIPLKIDNNFNLEVLKVTPTISYNDINSRPIKLKNKEIMAKISKEDIFNNDTFIYTISKNNGFLDDVITHNLKIKNTTNLELLDLRLTNNFFEKMDFIKNSLLVGDIHRIDEDICQEIKLGDLEKNEEIIVTFKTKVNKEELITNMQFLLNYSTDKKSMSAKSNTLDFKVDYPKFDNVSFKKYHSKNILRLNEIIDITIVAENIGTCEALDIFIKDYIPEGLEFINSSLYLNDENIDFDISTTALKLNSIKPYEKITIKYKARSIDICNDCTSKASISYKSSYDADSLSLYCDESKITIVGAKIGNNNIYMNISETTVQIDDILTYTIILENTGNVQCDYLKLEIPENNALEFVNESLSINNLSDKTLNIFDGLIFKNVSPGNINKITYQVQVISLPRPNPISDRAKLEYSYTLDNQSHVNVVYSNKDKLYINNPILSVVDKGGFLKEDEPDKFGKICFSGDDIYFNLELENKGNVGIENLYLKLNSLSHLNIDESSVKINNKNYCKIDNKKLYLPNLNVSQRVYLEFYAKHNTKKDDDIEVPLILDYTFKDLKNKNSYRKYKTIKENILVANPNLEISKFIADKDIEVDGEFTKNINIKNTGNILLTDIELNLNESDFLKDCKKIIFINGDYVKFDEKIYLDELDINDTINVAIRYSIDNIDNYQSAIPQSNVCAKYSLGENREPIPITKKSNKLNIDLKNYLVEVKGLSNTETIMVDTENKYMFNILNKGNIKCDFMKMKIDLPKEANYIENSLCINGKNIGVKSLDSSIDIGQLECGKLQNIGFNYTVNNLPCNNQFEILGVIQCEYKSEKESIKKVFTSDTKPLNIENIAIDIIKIPSLELLQSGDIVQLQTIINNIGSVDIYDMSICDNESKNLRFVENSTYIDGENVLNLNPIIGINIPSLGVNENVLITYEYEYCPSISSNKVTSFSNITYSYSLKNEESKQITTKSNVLYLEGALSTFKELSIDNEYELREYEPDIKEIISASTSSRIDQYYEIDSMKNISVENNQSTGKKVIIKGLAVDRIEYLTNEMESSLYMLERSKPFSVFINLPNDYDGEEIFFKPKCDNVYSKILDKRKLFISSLILIEGSF